MILQKKTKLKIYINKMAKEIKNLQEKKSFQKNWRLIQLMTKLENYQANINDMSNELNIGKNVNYKNQVSYRNLYITNPLIPIKGISIFNQNKIDQEGSIINGLKKRFPINANFVAQWLSENIVSSKAYKLSLLCDRIIKESKLNVKKKEKSNIDVNLVGIKIIISGRILGAEIATSKTFKAGQIPSNTIKIKKDIGFALAKTRSGTIGIKVIYFWS